MEKDFIFGICADVHHEEGKDECWRMKKFVDEARERGCEFIIQLGDFINANEAGKRMLDVWNSFPGPRYHVLGNHDTEHGGKDVIMPFQGQKEKYYSFDAGDYHFVVLDTNYKKVGDKFVDYGGPDYKKELNDLFNCYIPDEQLDWLRADLDATDKRCFIFTHATLEVGNWVVSNLHRLTDVFWRANEKAGFNKVTMCFSGHDHSDEYLFKGGIHYYVVNSMTQKYIGPKYANESTDADAVREDYGETKAVIPYKDPLYAFVRLKKNGLIQIMGKQSEYVGHSPMEIHWQHPASPEISYREVWMNGHGKL